MSLFRFGLGTSKVALGARPALTLELYEFEACPFCRKAREAISLLDLPTRIFPCPKDGVRFRPRAIELAGRRTFPVLVDPNQPESQRVLPESDRIVEALFARYGTTPAPALLRSGPLGNGLSALTSATRAGRGGAKRPSAVDRGAPEPRLELHAPEGLDAARPVREALCELELAYLVRPFAAGSAAPVLVDGTQRLSGADAIVRHLERTYA